MSKTFTLLTRIIRQGKSYIPYYILQGFIGLATTPLDAYGILLSIRLIDKGLLMQDWPVVQKTLLTLFMLFMVRTALTSTTPLFFTRVQLRVNRSFQDTLFAYLLHLPIRFFSKEPTGRLLSRIFSDATLFSNIFTILFNKALQDPLKLIFWIAVLSYFNLQLCALTLVSSVFFFLIIRYTGRKFHFNAQEYQKQNAAAFSFAEQVLANIELIKIKSTEKRTAAAFGKILDQMIQSSLTILKISLITQPVLQAITFCVLGIVFVYGSWLQSQGVLTIGTLVTFLLIAYQFFFKTIHSFGSSYGSLREYLARLEMIYAILDTPPEQTAKQSGSSSPLKIATLAFERICFSYEPGRPVLRDISFQVRSGAMLGLTGQSGSGKTTLLRLLARFYEPDSGEIKLNGRPYRDWDLPALRSALGVAFQENLILADTVLNNIRYGNENLSETRIEAAAQIAGIDDFIRSLPNQYATLIGEGGKSLSGGQRQRLAIARALVSDPEILLLDESTSFIEVEQESRILRKIKEIRKDKITILISHRLSAMQIADRILTLDQGQLMDVDFHALQKTL
ncbi:MAG: ABC transporter ATP-binding protein [Desulfobacteraceae bacterium]|nr:MAG: ABC transporter ATP-binding protein [Desulfobacteraceae bacterium]